MSMRISEVQRSRALVFVDGSSLDVGAQDGLVPLIRGASDGQDLCGLERAASEARRFAADVAVAAAPAPRTSDHD